MCFVACLNEVEVIAARMGDFEKCPRQGISLLSDQRSPAVLLNQNLMGCCE